MKKQTILGLLSVLFLFILIVSLTGIAGKYLGKNIEMIILVVIALILGIYLIVDKNKKE